jgi:hypothetical protein
MRSRGHALTSEIKQEKGCHCDTLSLLHLERNDHVSILGKYSSSFYRKVAGSPVLYAYECW